MLKKMLINCKDYSEERLIHKEKLEKIKALLVGDLGNYFWNFEFYKDDVKTVQSFFEQNESKLELTISEGYVVCIDKLDGSEKYSLYYKSNPNVTLVFCFDEVVETKYDSTRLVTMNFYSENEEISERQVFYCADEQVLNNIEEIVLEYQKGEYGSTYPSHFEDYVNEKFGENSLFGIQTKKTIEVTIV